MIGVDRLDDSVCRSRSFRLVGAKEAVPDHEHLSVVPIEVLCVGTVMNAMVGGGRENRIQPPQAPDQSRVLRNAQLK